jgi:hypothetical protein
LGPLTLPKYNDTRGQSISHRAMYLELNGLACTPGGYSWRRTCPEEQPPGIVASPPSFGYTALWGMCSCSLCRDACGEIAVRGRGQPGQGSLPEAGQEKRAQARMVECRVPMDRGNAVIKDGSFGLRPSSPPWGKPSPGWCISRAWKSRGARAYSSTRRGLRYGPDSGTLLPRAGSHVRDPARADARGARQ